MVLSNNEIRLDLSWDEVTRFSDCLDDLARTDDTEAKRGIVFYRPEGLIVVRVSRMTERPVGYEFEVEKLKKDIDRLQREKCALLKTVIIGDHSIDWNIDSKEWKLTDWSVGSRGWIVLASEYFKDIMDKLLEITGFDGRLKENKTTELSS